MQKIFLKEYKDDMGIFVDLEHSGEVEINSNEIKVSYDYLILNFKELLDKNKKYYIYCSGGVKSKKAVNILEFYGYNVTLVYKN